MQKDLESLGIPCTLVLDASIGYIMSEIDYVLVGAEESLTRLITITIKGVNPIAFSIKLVL